MDHYFPSCCVIYCSGRNKNIPTMILDKEQLSQVQQALNDNFTTLLDLYFTNSKIQIDEISKWQSNAESPAVMIAAHTLKSSSANLGLNQLASQCNLIESACEQNQEHNIPKLISALSPLYEESVSALKSAIT